MDKLLQDVVMVDRLHPFLRLRWLPVIERESILDYHLSGISEQGKLLLQAKPRLMPTWMANITPPKGWRLKCYQVNTYSGIENT